MNKSSVIPPILLHLPAQDTWNFHCLFINLNSYISVISNNANPKISMLA